MLETARRKLGELLGTPEEDNQQPSLENKISLKVQRLEIETNNKIGGNFVYKRTQNSPNWEMKNQSYFYY